MSQSKPDTTGDDVRAKAKPWTDIIAATRRAFMRSIQRDNDCRATGQACQDVKHCGCWLEMENAINAE